MYKISKLQNQDRKKFKTETMQNKTKTAYLRPTPHFVQDCFSAQDENRFSYKTVFLHKTKTALLKKVVNLNKIIFVRI